MAISRQKTSIYSSAITSAGTITTSWYPTKDLQSLIAFLYMATTVGTGADTLDVIMETAETNDATILAANPHYVRSVPLVNPLTGGITSKMAQVVGGTALPADTSTTTTLRQMFNINLNNLDTYFRFRLVAAGTPANLGTINLTVVSNVLL